MQKLLQVNDLIIKLRAIEESETTQYELIEKIKRQWEDDAFNDLLKPKK